MNTQLNSLTMRPAAVNDAKALRRLAQLDSKHEPSGEALVAEMNGELLAAVPLDGGPAIADPFERTAEIVSLLRARANQVNAAEPMAA